MQRKDKIILEKIINAVEVGLKIFNDVPLEKFLNDDEMKLSMSMSILRVGELVKNLSQEFRIENFQVKWKAIAGFRDVIAHKYDILDMEEVYKTIKFEFPELKIQIEKILEAEEI